MLWYCRYTWHHHTTREQVAQRVIAQHEAGTNQPDKIRGWFDLAGGGAGFLLVETDNPQDLTTMLQPYLDVMKIDVHAVVENDYNGNDRAPGTDGARALTKSRQRHEPRSEANDERSPDLW